MERAQIHVAITRVVKPGCEDAFEQAILRFFTASLATSDSFGAQLLRPLPGREDRRYGILRSFANEADRDAFCASALFRAWQEEVAPMVEGEYARRELHGLEAFFSDPGQLGHPPRWKMAVVTWLGVWPTAHLVNGALDPARLLELTGWWKGAVIAAIVVSLLTWAVMPGLTRLFHRWLRPPAPFLSDPRSTQ